jgi:ATP-binding cassette, subfamily C, bacterial
MVGGIRPAASKAGHYGMLRKAMRAVAPVFATAIIFSFFINLLLFVSPLYMLQIYDRVLGTRNLVTLAGITIIAAFLLLVWAGLEMLRSRLLVRAGMLFDEEMAAPMFRTVHRGTLREPSSLKSQYLRDVDVIREFFTGPGLIAFCDLPWFPVFVIVAFILHPWFGYIAIAGGFVTLLLALLNETMTRRTLQEASKASMLATQKAQATFRNAEVVHAMGMLEALVERWGLHHRKALELQARASDHAGAIIAFTKFFRILLQTVILGAGAYLAVEHEISAGMMIAASIIIGRALQPIEIAVGNWKGFLAARDAFARMKTLFAAAGAEPDRMQLPRPNGTLSVENLITAAPGGKAPILKGVSFSLEAGELLGVVGPSAAGKSSLARVLVGVWQSSVGAVRLDGFELSHWNPHELGQHVGYLPQDVELFEGTVAENIARFRMIDKDEILSAAQLAGCHELIQNLPEGYDTNIGDGGQILSGGQRQRVALARCLYGKPSLIVLDEPNANLDSGGEEALVAAIHRLKEAGTTVVLITHKVNILSILDKILIMGDGKVQGFASRDVILRRLTGPKVVRTDDGSRAGPEPQLGDNRVSTL